ncbi:hypothetical protein BDN70DRAFT_876476 [Pholiota conissans]|uniref:Uncharacterized protein n=1 Tax=Pholiota conissans TaxID=109636 RepID=A0A9P5Z570_9AGAR|nr:hypothetical protein BDN70DRAFT_876476 [Pholiota conissans]
MAMGFYTMSASAGELLGAWCNAVLYGLNILIFGSCMYILLKKRRDGKPVSVFFFSCAIIQFVISTIHVALNLRLIINAFLNVTDGPSASEAYLAQETIPEQIGMKVLYFLNSAIGDAVLVWRMYVVWGRNVHIAVLPSVMVIASVVTGFIATSIIAHGGDASWPLILKYLLASWSLSIIIQVSATCLIAYRIWFLAADIPAHVGPAEEKERTNYTSIIWVIVESGVIYTVSTIILLAFFELNSQASNIIGKALGQISAIVPTLILVRVNLVGEGQKRNPQALSIKFLSSLVPSFGTSQSDQDKSTFESHVDVVPSITLGGSSSTHISNEASRASVEEKA